MNLLRAARVALCLLVFGCGDRKEIPDGRIEIPGYGFVYTAPEGWRRRTLPGLEMPIAEGEPAFGIVPNLFVDGMSVGTLPEAAAHTLSRYRKSSNAYEELERTEFTTDSGLQGLRIESRRMSREALPLISVHYLVRHGDGVVGLTATCAEASFEKNEPLFDAAMQSLAVHSIP